jgi:hypothetical protein
MKKVTESNRDFGIYSVDVGSRSAGVRSSEDCVSDNHLVSISVSFPFKNGLAAVKANYITLRLWKVVRYTAIGAKTTN